ncbi:MAG: hypothetical protein N2316_09945, partial [Spirochaetes bacterium]|nr:hypothetical protein [Spirochaetota bacterium]
IGEVSGRRAGGIASLFKARLEVVGRPVLSDPPSGDNPDLVEGWNVKAARCYVIYPRLVTHAIDMWNRPAVTPYLWVRYEPVVQVDVKQEDFFTGQTAPANNVRCFFRVQYAAQH